jgi:hypothetical protein
MVALLGTIRDISNATAGRAGGRDYPAMCDAIDAAVLADFGGLPRHRRGGRAGVGATAVRHADGTGVPGAWDPLTANRCGGGAPWREPGVMAKAWRERHSIGL